MPKGLAFLAGVLPSAFLAGVLPTDPSKQIKLVNADFQKLLMRYFVKRIEIFLSRRTKEICFSEST